MFAFSMTIALALSADELDVERAATIEREQAHEVAAVAQKYGNKKSTELSRDERAAMIRELAAAERKVLDQHGVSPRAWAKSKQHRSREQAQQVERAAKAQTEREALEKKLAEEQAKEPVVSVQRGISEENPVVLEEKPGADPIVEQGLPADYQADQQAASEADAVEKAADAPPPKSGKSKR